MFRFLPDVHTAQRTVFCELRVHAAIECTCSAADDLYESRFSSSYQNHCQCPRWAEYRPERYNLPSSDGKKMVEDCRSLPSHRGRWWSTWARLLSEIINNSQLGNVGNVQTTFKVCLMSPLSTSREGSPQGDENRKKRGKCEFLSLSSFISWYVLIDAVIPTWRSESSTYVHVCRGCVCIPCINIIALVVVVVAMFWCFTRWPNCGWEVMNGVRTSSCVCVSVDTYLWLCVRSVCQFATSFLHVQAK